MSKFNIEHTKNIKVTSCDIYLKKVFGVIYEILARKTIILKSFLITYYIIIIHIIINIIMRTNIPTNIFTDDENLMNKLSIINKYSVDMDTKEINEHIDMDKNDYDCEYDIDEYAEVQDMFPDAMFSIAFPKCMLDDELCKEETAFIVIKHKCYCFSDDINVPNTYIRVKRRKGANCITYTDAIRAMIDAKYEPCAHYFLESLDRVKDTIQFQAHFGS